MNKNFIKIMAIYLIIMVSANLIHPITPEFIRVKQFPDFMFGVALAMMNLTNFLFSNFWGNVCDKKGRLKVMMIGCSGYAIGQLGFGFSDTVHTLILFRLLSGFFTGAFTVPILAYISDISSSDEIKKHFSIFVTSTAVASAIGYYIGGMVGSLELIYTFFLQVVLLIIVVSLLMTLKEFKVFNEKLNKKQIINSLNPFQVFLKNNVNKTIILMLSISFFVYFANTMFDNSFSYYLSAQLKLKPMVNGVIKAITGLSTLVLNLLLINKLVKKYHTNKIIKIILFISISSLMGVLFSLNKYMFFGFSMLFYVVFLSVVPLQQSFIMENIDENFRGSASGMINAIRAIAGVLASLLAGALYGKLPEVNLPYANIRIAFPIVISSICIILALSMVYYSQWRSKK